MATIDDLGCFDLNVAWYRLCKSILYIFICTVENRFIESTHEKKILVRGIGSLEKTRVWQIGISLYSIDFIQQISIGWYWFYFFSRFQHCFAFLFSPYFILHFEQPSLNLIFEVFVTSTTFTTESIYWEGKYMCRETYTKCALSGHTYVLCEWNNFSGGCFQTKE